MIKENAASQKFQTGNILLISFVHLLHDIYGSFLSPLLPRLIGITVPVLMWPFLLNPGILTLPVLGILGFFLFSTGPIMLAIVQESGSERPAYVNGIYMMLNFVLSSVMIIIIGVLNAWVGLEATYRVSTWWFFGTIPCLFFLPGRFFPRKIQRGW